jgi:hypothetical protein
VDYKKIMGYGKKKKLINEKTKNNPVIEDIKQELNEWNDTTFRNKPKRWSGAYGRKDGLTEFEDQGGKDFIKEGPAYEYKGHIQKIDKLYDAYWDSVKDFEKLLVKKGLKKEAHNLHSFYTKFVVRFHQFFEKFVRKLM